MIRDGWEYTDNFDGQCYLDRYPDVKADGKYDTPEKALLHWQTFGQAEGRIPGCLIGPAKEGEENDDTPPVTTASNKNGLLIAGAGLLIVFHKQLAKLFKIKI